MTKRSPSEISSRPDGSAGETEGVSRHKSSDRMPESHALRNAILAALAIGAASVAGYQHCSKSTSENTKAPIETTGKVNFAKLASSLKDYGKTMDPENQQRFAKVIALLESNLAGVQITQEDISDTSVPYLAASKIGGTYEEGQYEIALGREWNPNNGKDLSLLIHELFHIVESRESRSQLSKQDWVKRYAAPRNMVEIRSELGGWELGLVFADKYSGGLFEQYTQELQTVPVGDDDGVRRLLEKYTNLLMKKMNVTDEDGKKTLWNWLIKYDSLTFSQLKKMDCKWSYNFVTNIAGQYMKLGAQPYEIDMPRSATHRNVGECLYPLGNGPYQQYRPYIKRADGLTVPSENPVRFPEIR